MILAKKGKFIFEFISIDSLQLFVSLKDKYIAAYV